MVEVTVCVECPFCKKEFETRDLNVIWLMREEEKLPKTNMKNLKNG